MDNSKYVLNEVGKGLQRIKNGYGFYFEYYSKS